MSVIVAKRTQSPVQFVDTAMLLVEHTIRYTRKQFNNKDYDIVRRLRDMSMNILDCVTKANGIFPKSNDDLVRRYMLFREAKSQCFSMITLVSVIKNVLQNTVTNYGWQKWGEYLSQEIDLMNKIIKSDNARGCTL